MYIMSIRSCINILRCLLHWRNDKQFRDSPIHTLTWLRQQMQNEMQMASPCRRHRDDDAHHHSFSSSSSQSCPSWNQYGHGARVFHVELAYWVGRWSGLCGQGRVSCAKSSGMDQCWDPAGCIDHVGWQDHVAAMTSCCSCCPCGHQIFSLACHPTFLSLGMWCRQMRGWSDCSGPCCVWPPSTSYQMVSQDQAVGRLPSSAGSDSLECTERLHEHFRGRSDLIHFVLAALTLNVQGQVNSVQHIKYYGCWCPGSLRCQVISSNAIWLCRIGKSLSWGRISTGLHKVADSAD